MAKNLWDQAKSQLEKAAASEAGLRGRLDAATTALARQVPDPSVVPPETWRTVLGADQYLAAAVARESELLAAEADIRRRLAAIPTSADHAEPLAQLAANLRAQAQARVLRRDAQELAAVCRADIAALGSAVAAAAELRARSAAWAAQAQALQVSISADKAILAVPPLSKIAADATALEASPVTTAAGAMLRGRLPAKLVDRSGQRWAEAGQIEEDAVSVRAAARSAAEGTAVSSRPVETNLVNSARDLEQARSDLRTYMATAPELLARAADTYKRIAALPALTPDETAALDPASALRPDAAKAVDALELEKKVAEAWQAYEAKDIEVQQATFQAIAADPDADPTKAQPVIAAVAARDAVRGALDTAKTAYTAEHQKALDSWELAAPPWLWAAARDFHTAAADLQRLADPLTAGGLLTRLDTAVDKLADARDADAELGRAVIHSGVEAARSEARAAATTASAAQRLAAFVRGDSIGGRHAGEY
jgi:hypothetical protein